ncbi:MAG: hypothetical protein WA655_19790 [Candidatus Korobacteraceae bacterium]
MRKNLAQRIKRSGMAEDYDPTGKRLPAGPKFDHRSGALSAFATRPFTEFAVLCEDGDTIDPVEVIEGQLERKRLQTVSGDEDNNGSVMPADRESKRLLGRRTMAEKLEALQCARMLQALQHDKPAFEEALAKAIVHLRGIALQMGLDQNEAEVAAVMSLLWDAGPRTYLNFLDRTDKRRIRNAWDRLDRRRKESGFRLKLRELARNGPRDEDPELVKSAATAKHDGTICLLRVLKPAGKLAGVPWVSWHTFRRTHATLLQLAGGSAKDAQAQLGHSQITTTLGIYMFPVPAHQREAVEKLSEMVTNGDEFGAAGKTGIAQPGLLQ